MKQWVLLRNKRMLELEDHKDKLCLAWVFMVLCPHNEIYPYVRSAILRIWNKYEPGL